MPQMQSENPLPMRHLLALRDSRCVFYPGSDECSCGRPHAEELPANRDPHAIPGDLYENMPGWTAQIQTRVYEQPHGAIDESSNQAE